MHQLNFSMRELQMALELAQAQRRAVDCADGVAAEKARLTEAKMARQAQMVAALDARLQAAHAALDESAQGVREWGADACALLGQYAGVLTGTAPIPGALNRLSNSSCLSESRRFVA
jgi:hypothetical protein